MTERTFDFEADYGAGYEALARRVLFGYDQLFAMALSWLRQGVGEEAQALVVGSGPGMELAHFGALEPGWRLTGVDPSAQMVALAREKVRANGLADRVTLVHGLVDDLPAEPGFDAASAVCVMHFLRDDGSKRAFLDGIARRLRPGARLALFEHGDLIRHQ